MRRLLVGYAPDLLDLWRSRLPQLRGVPDRLPWEDAALDCRLGVDAARAPRGSLPRRMIGGAKSVARAEQVGQRYPFSLSGSQCGARIGRSRLSNTVGVMKKGDPILRLACAVLV